MHFFIALPFVRIYTQTYIYVRIYVRIYIYVCMPLFDQILISLTIASVTLTRRKVLHLTSLPGLIYYLLAGEGTDYQWTPQRFHNLNFNSYWTLTQTDTKSKKSLVWPYFAQSDGQKVDCKVCKQQFNLSMLHCSIEWRAMLTQTRRQVWKQIHF